MQARMRQAYLFVALAVVLSGTASVRLVAQSPTAKDDPGNGLWKLNLEKSKFTTGQPPKTSVLKQETTADGFIVVTQTTINAQGNPGFFLVRFKTDGQDYPQYSAADLVRMLATGAKPGTATFKRIDVQTFERTEKDNTGKVTGTTTRVVSTDGKTSTMTFKDASGNVRIVHVWDRQ
jgi:hypothetical protein